MTLLCRAAGLVLTALLPVALLTLSLWLTLRSDWPSPLLFNALGIEQRVPNAWQQHQWVLDFYWGERSRVGSALTPPEQQHLQDIKGLLRVDRWTGAGTLLLGQGLFWLCGRPWRVLSKGSLLLLGLLSGLGLLATRWVLLFRGLHPLLFPGGGWDFDPAVHLLPRLYPQDYLALYAGAVLGTAVVGAGLLYALGRWRGPQADALRWHWGRREWRVLAAGVGLSWPAWWVGQHMYLPGDAAWGTFYGLAAMLLAATVTFWLSPDKARGGALLLAAMLPYQSFACGVRHAAMQARDYVASEGTGVVAALESYRDERGKAPPSLDDLVPRYLMALPPTPAGESWWYLHSPNFRHYGVGFAGPLAYRHMYASPSGQWELLPLP